MPTRPPFRPLRPSTPPSCGVAGTPARPREAPIRVIPAETPEIAAERPSPGGSDPAYEFSVDPPPAVRTAPRELVWKKVPRTYPPIYRADGGDRIYSIHKADAEVTRASHGEEVFRLFVNGRDFGQPFRRRQDAETKAQEIHRGADTRAPSTAPVRRTRATAFRVPDVSHLPPMTPPAQWHGEPLIRCGDTTTFQNMRRCDGLYFPAAGTGDADLEDAAILDSPNTAVTLASAVPLEASLPGATVVTASATTEWSWSPRQNAVFEWVTKGTGDAVIVARAGSGKTTTLVQVVKLIPSHLSILAVAFNKTIRDELKARMGGLPNVEVHTLNGHGFRAVARAWAPIDIPKNADEYQQVAQDAARFQDTLRKASVPNPVSPWDDDKERRVKGLTPAQKTAWETVALENDLLKVSVEEYRYDLRERERVDQLRMAWNIHVRPWNRHLKQLKQLIELSRAHMAMTPEAIAVIQKEFRLLGTVTEKVEVGRWPSGKTRFDFREGAWTYYDWRYQMRELLGNRAPHRDPRYTLVDVYRWVIGALQASLVRPEDGKIARFDCVFPVAMLDAIQPKQFDWVLVDETQDMDPAQLRMVQKSRKPGGRILLIGDDLQSIYRFRGADTEAIPRMLRELHATRLPLSESRRVPACVADRVRTFVDDFTVPPGTPQGVCESITAKQMLRTWENGDFVISYKNAPLVPLALLAISQGKLALALGLGDLTKGLLAIVRAVSRKAPKDLAEFEAKLREWAKGEKETLIEREGRRLDEEQERAERVARARGEDASRNDEAVVAPEESPKVVEFGLGIDAVLALADRSKTIEDLDAKIRAISLSAKKIEAMGEKERKGVLAGKLVFSTVHRIKGAEANTTFVLDETFRFREQIGPDGRPIVRDAEKMSDAEQQEHINLRYVAITRAKNERGDPAKGIEARPGRLFFVVQLADILGGGYKLDADENPLDGAEEK